MIREKALEYSDSTLILGNLSAEIEASTDSSVCLRIRRLVDKKGNLPPDAQWLFSDSPETILEEIGWVDLHYPCRESRQVLIRMCLPYPYHNMDCLNSINTDLLRAFAIPEEAVRIIYYFSADSMFCILPDDEFGRG
jgi:hypothetical protein